MDQKVAREEMERRLAQSRRLPIEERLKLLVLDLEQQLRNGEVSPRAAVARGIEKPGR